MHFGKERPIYWERALFQLYTAGSFNISFNPDLMLLIIRRLGIKLAFVTCCVLPQTQFSVSAPQAYPSTSTLITATALPNYQAALGDVTSARSKRCDQRKS